MSVGEDEGVLLLLLEGLSLLLFSQVSSHEEERGLEEPSSSLLLLLFIESLDESNEVSSSNWSSSPSFGWVLFDEDEAEAEGRE